MSELKPCPFCGGKAQVHKHILSLYGAMVRCSVCGASTVVYKNHNIEDAVQFATYAWNRRDHDQR